MNNFTLFSCLMGALFLWPGCGGDDDPGSNDAGADGDTSHGDGGGDAMSDVGDGGGDATGDAGDGDAGDSSADATCEADLLTDPNNCGSCGKVCPHLPSSLPSCAAGECVYACLEGYDDCNGDLAADSSDGCEVDLTSDALHCGECNAPCTASGDQVIPSCSSRGCGVACEPDFADCNHDILDPDSDGCETNTAISAENCGYCGYACSADCVDSHCEGEDRLCRVFADEAPDPVGVELATDGAGFGMAWTDSDNDGLWVGPLEPDGAQAGEPLRIADVRSYYRFGLGFDGSEYVVAWEDQESLRVQRITVDFELSGEPIVFDPEEGASTIIVSSTDDGVLVTWFNNAVQAAFLPAGAAAPLETHSVEQSWQAETWDTFDLVATGLGNGFLLSWLSRHPAEYGDDLMVPVIRTLDATGVPQGFDDVLDPSRDMMFSAPMVFGQVGDGAVGIFPEDFGGADALAFDSQGAPNWDESETPLWHDTGMRGRLFALAPSAQGAWLGTIQEELVVRQLDRTGEPVSAPQSLLRIPPTTRLRFRGATNDDGALFAWVRSFPAGLGALELIFLTTDGTAVDPCL